MRPIAWAGLLVAACGCGDNASPPFVPLASGPAQLSIFDGSLVLSRGNVMLVTLPPDAFQIATVDDLDSGASFDPYWLFVDSPPAPPDGFAWHAARGLHVIASDSQGFTLSLDDDIGRLEVTPSTSGDFRIVFSSAHDRVAYLRVQPHVTEQERFYGLGEWGDAVEHHGKLRPMQIEVDPTSESSTNEAHVPVPLLLSTKSWGVFVQSQRPGVFDVARMDPAKVDIAFGTGDDSATGLTLQLLSAETPLDLMKPYFDLTGYPGLPAVWAYGPLLWRDETVDEAQAMDDIQQIRSRDLATSGIWFDRPYATGVNTFDWNPAKFPTPATMLQALHDAGLRYGIWHAPYVAPGGNDQDPAPAENQYATQHGFFPPVTGVLVNQWGKPIDFTNPEAYAWWQDKLHAYTDPLELGGSGVEGFKLDYGEDVVVGLAGQRAPWKFADGSDERTMHDGYTLLYHGIYRDTLDAAGGFLLTRTGRWGDQTRGMIVWPGDLQANLSRFGDPKPGSSMKTVGGLPTALSFGIGLSASGFPFYASDTGGYRSSPPSNETWLRWVEANAVWPAMQVGDSSSQMPWEFTAENGRTTASLDTYRKYARLHLRLFPYVWSLAQQMMTTGYPIVRPFGLAVPQAGMHPDDEYFLGSSLLVAPVITAGATGRDVALPPPPQQWLDWWTGAPATPHATADLDALPLYIVRGAIVPMLRDTIDTLAPTTQAGVESYANDPGTLDVRIAFGPPAQFMLFDGGTIETSLEHITFVPGTRFKAGALFEVIATGPPAAVRADTVALTPRGSYAALVAASEGWFHDPAQTGGTLWIKVPGGADIIIQ